MAERRNQTLLEATRAMLQENNMPRIYWAEAIQTTVYIQNRITALGTKVLPHKLYSEWKLNLVHLRVFDNIAYVHVPNEKRKKLDA